MNTLLQKKLHNINDTIDQKIPQQCWIYKIIHYICEFI